MPTLTSSNPPHKRTKIIGTLGPATSSSEVIEQLILSGANAFRLNFSHGSADDHRARAILVRTAAQKLNQHVALLGDLQGPKIRIGKFADNAKYLLQLDDEITLDCGFTGEGDRQRVGVTYPQLAEDCRPGQVLLLDDGRLEFEILSIEGMALRCRVLVGGTISSNKGINLREGGLSAPALTEKDYVDIQVAAELKLDYLAISFPRSVQDIELAREAMLAVQCDAMLVAKIERAEAVASNSTLDAIIEASDAVMVARGDLGVEIGDSELIGVQKKIIKRARQLNRVVITATQMMESMIEQPLPTRAEVFDVANAVLDGTDVVMLSAETATGKFPIKVVEAMTRIIQGAEKHSVSQPVSRMGEAVFNRPDQAIAVSAMFAANHYPAVKAIVCLTETGNTPMWMSRIRSGIPIYAFSRSETSLRRMALFRGVTGYVIDSQQENTIEILKISVSKLQSLGHLRSGEVILATAGDHFGEKGGTNTLKILTVP